MQNALSFLQAEKFDLLISDIGLPDGTGHTLITQAKLLQKEIRGIALSGFGMEEDLRRSAEAGFEFHLTKPVNIGLLKELLGRVALGC